MIQIVSDTANEAWIETFRAIYDKGTDTDNTRYFRDEVVLIEITKPELLPADGRFPMSQAEINTINEYIVSGKNEDKVTHEWTKLYHHRAFDSPNSQVEFLLRKLNADRPAGETQISMWDKNIDQDQEISPCTQIVWARIKHGKLELHVHANSSDAYKKLLMNMLEFISLQHYLAKRAGLRVGSYIHFLDSCHFHNKDLDNIRELRSIID